MKAAMIIVALFTALAWCGLADIADGDKNRPVSKVIALLKDMQKQLQAEADEDEAVYEKMSCWCETNDKEKTKAIADAEAKVADLTHQIEEFSATSARLSAEIQATEKEVAANQDALNKATALRTKEKASFNAEDKELIQSVRALEAAITVLSKHHSLLQAPHTHMLGVAATLQHELQQHAALLQGVLSPSERRAVTAFVQDQEGFLNQQTKLRAQPYAAQSGQIFGILQQMLDTFKSNMNAAQKEELAAQKAYENLKAAKEAEIAAGQDQINTKNTELANSDESMARAKQDKKDTMAQLSADQQFLMAVKEKCSMTDKEWEERQKTRAEELEAVSKALAVLSTDDAHDTFTRTFNAAASFVQLQSANQAARHDAAEVLAAAAQKAKNPVLAALAVQAKLDAFEKVKAAIDKMVTQLLQEKKDEIAHKDFCVENFNNNQQKTEAKERSKKDTEADIASHTSNIEELAKSIAKTEEEMAEMQKQIKQAGENRERENKDFHTVITDQRATQKLLQGAIRYLKSFYDKQSLLQQQQPELDAPAGFKTYKTQDTGVIGLLDQILADTKALEAESTRAEENSQKAYEDFVMETNAGLGDRQVSLTNQKDSKAKEEAGLVEDKQAHEAVVLELKQLSNENNDLHESCDFVLKNFDVRQTARDEEVEALRQAKAILSGMKA